MMIEESREVVCSFSRHNIIGEWAMRPARATNMERLGKAPANKLNNN